jgi:hypothetical protein
MKPDQHITISVGSGVILGMLSRSWVAGVSCCMIGIFIDADHFFDLWLNRGFTLSPRKLLDFCYHGESRKFFALLHGYEYIPLLIWLAFLPGYGHLGLGLSAGYVLHLLGDQFFKNHLDGRTYFLSYRLWNRFESSRIVLSRTRSARSDPHRRSF